MTRGAISIDRSRRSVQLASKDGAAGPAPPVASGRHTQSSGRPTFWRNSSCVKSALESFWNLALPPAGSSPDRLLLDALPACAEAAAWLGWRVIAGASQLDFV